MSVRLIDPAKLHAQAELHHVRLESLPWADGVDASRPFAPETLAQLYYAPSWELLDADDRREYARVVGLALAEMFIFLEEMLLVPAVAAFAAKRRKTLDPALLACLNDFVEEERVHSEMFKRLLAAADPAAGPARKPRVYGGRVLVNLALRTMMRFPEVFICWIWLAQFFEERTIDLFRQYQAAPEVEPLFTAVHRAHMVDETRHVSIDHHLVAALWDPAPLWLRRVNVWLLSRILGLFTAPTTSPTQAVAAMIARAPRLEAHRETFMRDIAGLRDNEAFQRANYSREVLPRTFALMDRYPELEGVRAAVPLYTPVRP